MQKNNKDFYEEYRNKKDSSFCEPWGNVFHYEYKSNLCVGGLPLVHINIGAGKYKAKGIIALGTYAQGVVALGIVSVGIVSIGIVSLGLIAIGLLALGALAAGGVSLGIIAVGGIAAGIVSVGGISAGVWSEGGICYTLLPPFKKTGAL